MKIINKITLFAILMLAISSKLYAIDDWEFTSGPKNGLGDYESVYSVKVHNDIVYAGTGMGGLYKSTDNGSSWIKVWEVEFTIYVIFVDNNGNFFAATVSNGLWKSSDNCQTWTQVLNTSSWITCLANNSTNVIYAGTENEGLYYSTDGGDNWVILWSEPLTIFSLACASNDNIIVGTIGNGIFVSTDLGLNFNPTNITDLIVWTMKKNTSGDKIFVGTEENGIYVSTDNGLTWDFNNLPGFSVGMLFINSHDNIMIGNNNIDIYLSYDQNNYTNISEGLQLSIVSAIDFMDDGYAFAATYDHGVVKTRRTSFEPTLSTLDGSGTYCAGTTLSFNFDGVGGFYPENKFIAQLSNSSGNFTSPVNIDTVIGQSGGTFTAFVPINTPSGSGYRVRVISTEPAMIANNNGTDIIINGLGSEEQLELPLDNSIDVALKPSLKWKSHQCASSYKLEVATNSDFSNVVFSQQNIPDTTFTLPDKLSKNTLFYWRVAPVNNQGFFSFSNPYSFTTVNIIIETQTIILKNGWNIISSYIPVEIDTLPTVCANIISNLVIMKNNAGKSYIPSFSINDIGKWKIEDGYQVFMTAKDTLEMTGTPVDPETVNIVTPLSWRMVSYLRKTPMSTITALESLTDRNNLVIAKNSAGLTYIPQFNIYNLANLIPGEGYKLYLSALDTLVYPANSGGKLSAGVVTDYSTRFIKNEFEYTGNNMIAILDLGAKFDGYEIAAVNSEGKVVGSSTVKNGISPLVIWGDDLSSPEKDGLDYSDPFSLIAYNPENSKSYEVNSIDITNIINNQKINNLSYSNDLLIKAKLSIIENEGNDITLSPNPVTDFTTITFNLDENSDITLALYDLNGKFIETKNIGNFAKGKNNYNYQVPSDLMIGVYQLVLSGNGNSKSVRLIISTIK